MRMFWVFLYFKCNFFFNSLAAYFVRLFHLTIRYLITVKIFLQKFFKRTNYISGLLIGMYSVIMLLLFVNFVLKIISKYKISHLCFLLVYYWSYKVIIVKQLKDMKLLCPLWNQRLILHKFGYSKFSFLFLFFFIIDFFFVAVSWSWKVLHTLPFPTVLGQAMKEK